MITGLLLGIVIAMLGRLVAAAGHRMYARGITRQLKSNVADVAQRAVVAPVEDELNRLADYRAALEQAR